MDLKTLLNKTAKKNKVFDVPKIKPFSIAMDDRPYDELLPKEKPNIPTSSLDEVQETHIEPKEEKVILAPEATLLPLIQETVSVVEPAQVEITKSDDKPSQENFEIKVKKNRPIVKPKKIIEKKDIIQKQKPKNVIDKIISTKELPPSIEEVEALATNKFVDEKPLFQDPGTAFLLLSGCQKKIVDYFFELSIKNNTSKIGPITTDTIALTLGITSETFRKSIQRLKTKGIIYIYLSKEGRGGWSIYSFNSAFYQELLSNARIKSGLKVDVQPNVNLPESTVLSRVGDLPAIWSNLEYQDLSEYGFTKSHLIQIYKDQEKASVTLDSDSMQYSLDAFKFDMENNQNILKERLRNKSPVMFLTQILGKGRPYGSFTPEKFKTPEQIAILRYKEKQEQINKELQTIKDTYFETEFQSWYENLTEQDSDELAIHLNLKLDGVPPKLRSTYKMRSFKEHFSQFLWQDVVKRLRNK